MLFITMSLFSFILAITKFWTIPIRETESFSKREGNRRSAVRQAQTQARQTSVCTETKRANGKQLSALMINIKR